MEIKRLETGSLSDALKRMEVGEVRLAPLGYANATVSKTCSELNKTGKYRFFTTAKTGDMVVARTK